MDTVSAKIWLVVLAIWLGVVSTASAQEWLQLAPLRGQVSVSFDGTWQDSEGGDNQRDTEFEERVRLQQSGSILAPGIASFSLAVEPAFSQGEFHSSTLGDDSRTSEFLNYNGRLSLLHGTASPVNLQADAGRIESDADGGFGSRSEIENTYWGTALNWTNAYFPVTLKFRENVTKEDFRSSLGGSPNKRDDRLRTAILSANSSKLSLNLERVWFDDREITDSDYTSNRADLSHRFDWGKGSNLNSRFHYLERDGLNDIGSATINENVRLKHTDNLDSRLNYVYENRWEPQEVERHQGSYGLTHRLYRNLTTTLTGGGRFRKADFGEETEYNGGLSLGYQKRIFGDGRFSANVGGRYSVTDRDSEGGVLSVVDEPHVVNDPTGPNPTTSFLLDERFIDTGTIVITNDTGTFTYTPGPDYVVVPVGNDLTQIQLPGGSQILTDAASNPPGITVLVSYNFETLPSFKYSTTTYNYGSRLDFGWISIFHRGSASDQKRLSGQDGDFLTDRWQHRSGMDLRWRRDKFRATAGVEYSFTDYDEFQSDSLGFNQNLSYSPSRTISWNFSAGQTFTDTDGSTSEIYSADLSMSWWPWPNLSLRPYVSAWYRRDEGDNFGGTREEDFQRGGLDLNWTWRNVDFDLRYYHTRRGGDVAETNEDRLTMTVSRRF